MVTFLKNQNSFLNSARDRKRKTGICKRQNILFCYFQAETFCFKTVFVVQAELQLFKYNSRRVEYFKNGKERTLSTIKQLLQPSIFLSTEKYTDFLIWTDFELYVISLFCGSAARLKIDIIFNVFNSLFQSELNSVNTKSWNRLLYKHWC